ncbi:Ger(x)C family spore germination protein [Anaerobacillus sp. CMMVII]|uniref:Ger(x)C family spore germination protein n=1 Tax=Anaerobacillus sp. CMMVII TaxID=2755588 RepID=UPI0021B73A27|nr:Ger(x)C family spore germination protein [Anaerobacillus sp. CMMVII]MCT8138351.1 Ger(x)C family spore germination protein [Anaerobacillus sp. CMMVII]
MRRFGLLLILLVTLSFITGCWDQLLLKDTNILFIAGTDLGKNGEYEGTVSISKPGVNGTGKAKIVTGKGNTLRATRMDIDSKVSGILDSSKIKVLLIHEELAKIDLYPILDLYYRDPRAPLNARIAITKDLSNKLINLQVEGESLISDYFYELIKGAEVNSVVPKRNIQFICPIMVDPGRDFSLPLIMLNNIKEEELAQIAGTALFDGKKMSGELNREESLMVNLLNNKKAKRARFTVKIADEKRELEALNYITFEVSDFTSKLNVKAHSENNVEANFQLKLYLNVLEYPPDGLGDRDSALKLNRKIGEELTTLATTTIQKLQNANCDYFGIGREIIAYHNHAWNEKRWKEIYSTMPIKIQLDVEIIQHGIIN